MTRQLVVCIDGTNNRFSHRPTNVVRHLCSLSKDPAQVLSYYDQGVGTFGIKETLLEWQKVPSRLCGLAFGWGLKRNVEGAYSFLARHHAEGDEVYIFGFSRGAFAARALAAIIRAVGLVPAHQTHLFEYAWSMLLAREGPDRKPDFELQDRFRATFGRPIRVRFLGLYDTVKSVGWIYDPVVIPYTAGNQIVDIVRHAVSIDERRCFFRQHLWTKRSDFPTDVKEVWFAGVHSDIGGGYPPEQAQLALLAFRWMLDEALASGLHLDRDACKGQLEAAPGVHADAHGRMHESMNRGWKLAEWVPRRVWSGTEARKQWQIGAMPPLRKPRPRIMSDESSVHRSVAQRAGAPTAYKPPNLPKQVHVVDDSGLLDAFLREPVQVAEAALS